MNTQKNESLFQVKLQQADIADLSDEQTGIYELSDEQLASVLLEALALAAYWEAVNK
jgi:hypothetical protein